MCIHIYIRYVDECRLSWHWSHVMTLFQLDLINHLDDSSESVAHPFLLSRLLWNNNRVLRPIFKQQTCLLADGNEVLHFWITSSPAVKSFPEVQGQKVSPWPCVWESKCTFHLCLKVTNEIHCTENGCQQQGVSYCSVAQPNSHTPTSSSVSLTFNLDLCKISEIWKGPASHLFIWIPEC